MAAPTKRPVPLDRFWRVDCCAGLPLVAEANSFCARTGDGTELAGICPRWSRHSRLTRHAWVLGLGYAWVKRQRSSIVPKDSPLPVESAQGSVLGRIPRRRHLYSQGAAPFGGRACQNCSTDHAAFLLFVARRTRSRLRLVDVALAMSRLSLAALESQRRSAVFREVFGKTFSLGHLVKHVARSESALAVHH